ncbi:glycosyltransferase family 61 protein [Paracoccus liaowanqingii]|uniref:Glycosyltransferase family 61 protein n=2 Tax=Paracoccus liaowanqingii TaxID=2560053 RepID=A0A4P7HPU8_9RHOB|nr:glycosyltransferase family 61 protein [Paracoccus liaowanqingii]
MLAPVPRQQKRADNMLHSFAKDSGIRLLEYPEDMLTETPLGDIAAYNLLENERRSKIFDAHLTDYYWQRRMVMGFSVRTILAEIQRPKLKGTYITTRGKIVLNGAAAHRARNKLRKDMKFAPESVTIFDRLIDPRSLKLTTAQARSVWIDAKNLHNFFHFTSESLHQAFVAGSLAETFDDITFATKNKRIEPYIERWVADCNALVTPHLSAKAFSQNEADDVPSVVMPISCEHLLYQFSGDHHGKIAAARPAGHNWTGYDAKPHAVKTLQLNSFDQTLVRFREAMVERAQATVRKTWSKLIYTARAEGLARKRVMKGETELIRSLTALGFEVVHFENMSPLEQVKCVNDADCVIGQHSAGLTNMLFAREDAHVFEIATYQTAVSRWVDFIPLCHAAGCHYRLIVVGMDFADEDKDPSFNNDGFFAPVVSEKDTHRIIDIVTSGMKDRKDGRMSGLLRHCRFFMDRNAYAQAYRLLDANMAFFSECPEYWEQRGQLAETCGHNRRAHECYSRLLSLSESDEAWQGLARIKEKQAASGQ